jgi:hypothetical protein
LVGCKWGGVIPGNSQEFVGHGTNDPAGQRSSIFREIFYFLSMAQLSILAPELVIIITFPERNYHEGE